jgi:hypothetical protein
MKPEVVVVVVVVVAVVGVRTIRTEERTVERLFRM